MKKVEELRTERELQDDLAEFLREIGLLTFTEIQIPDLHGSRADIIALQSHRYSAKDIRLYEVKRTRSVWLADKKFQKYMECCNRMYIACPQGVIKKDEVPKELGLIVRSDKGWRVVKAPKVNINPQLLTVDFVFSLLYRGYEETLAQRSLRDKLIAEENASLKKRASKLGYDIAKRIDRSKETKIEKWCEELWEIFKPLGYEVPEEICTNSYYGERVNLPSIYNISKLINGSAALTKDVAIIKAIGEYLKSIDISEDENRYSYESRKEKREKALELIQERNR